MTAFENEADALRHQIEGNIYSLFFFGKNKRRYYSTDRKIWMILLIFQKAVLFQFEIERPYIPAELYADFIKLTELSTMAVESLIPAAKAYFKILSDKRENPQGLFL